MKEEKLIFCPLECGVRIKSLAKHLLKCKNIKLLGVKYKKCEYNPFHIIKNEFYELHLISCESKKKIEEWDYDSNDDDLKEKLKDEDEFDNNNNTNKEESEIKNINDKEINSKTKTIKKKKRYVHEKALFKDENEIDKDCLNFFHKVYV